MFIHLLVLHGQKAISKQQMEEIFNYLFLYYFKRKLAKNGVESLVGMKNTFLMDQIKENIANDYDSYFTLG